MPVAFLDDVRYYTDQRYFARHFRWPRASRPYRKVLYHCFWSGELTQHHELCLKSLLVTQSPPYRIWLWLSGRSTRKALPRWLRVLPALSVRELHPEREVIGTPFAQRLELLTAGTPSNISDALRLLAMLKY